MNNNREIYYEWIIKAQEDEVSIKAILKNNSGSPSTACFLSQQMAEKYLKSLIVFKKMEISKIHDLLKLADILKEVVSNIFDLEEEMIVLNKYYIVTRYPADLPEGFSWDDAQKAFECAVKIKEFVLKEIA